MEKVGSNCEKLYFKENGGAKRRERIIDQANEPQASGWWLGFKRQTHTHTNTHTRKRPQTHSSRLRLIAEWSHLSKSKCCSRLHPKRQRDRQGDSLEGSGENSSVFDKECTVLSVK